MDKLILRTTFTILLLCLLLPEGFSQEILYRDDAILEFNQEEFDGRFCVLGERTGENNYYVADLTRFPDRFSRIYFLNLVFKEQIVVNIDPNIEKDQLWFKSHVTFPEEDVICRMDELLEETLESQQGMTEGERAAWMEKYDKYSKKNTSNELK